MADLVISRAGANAIFELLALRKAHLLIPLSSTASRGDQLLNAESFRKQGFSMVLPEEELTPGNLISAIKQLAHDKDKYIKAMETSKQANAIDAIMEIIQIYCK